MTPRDALASFPLSTVDFERGGGLVTVVAQHAVTGAVLMIAFADRVALERTIATGEMHYHSRRRGLWHKGATSGHVQHVLSLAVDCDGDAILARVLPAGPACHTGDMSCFGTNALESDALSALDRTIAQRRVDDAATSSYTRRLLEERNLRLKKLGEEVAELVVACADDDRDRVREECADLLYHLLVAAHASDVTIDDIRQSLFSRAR